MAINTQLMLNNVTTYIYNLYNIYVYSMHDYFLSCLVLSCPIFTLRGYFTKFTHNDAHARRQNPKNLNNSPLHLKNCWDLRPDVTKSADVKVVLSVVPKSTHEKTGFELISEIWELIHRYVYRLFTIPPRIAPYIEALRKNRIITTKGMYLSRSSSKPCFQRARLSFSSHLA